LRLSKHPENCHPVRCVAHGQSGPGRLAVLFLLSCLGAWPRQDTCPALTAAYKGYTITEVKLIDPVGFVIPFNPLDMKLRDGLRLKKDGTFAATDYRADFAWLAQTLDAQFDSSHQQVRFTYAGGAIVDCNPAQPDATHKGTLRVLYPVFTSVLPLPLPTFEEQSSESKRPATTGSLRAEDKNAEVVPLGGNDATRGFFGGLSFSDETKALDFAGQTELSGNSQSGLLTLGSPGAVHGATNHPTVWGASLQYDNIPAGALRYKETKLHVRLSTATKEFGASQSIFRFGGAGEFGRQDSSVTGTAVPVDSNFASLKLYAGLTGRPGTSGFTASSGVQLGRALRIDAPMFGKFLLDTAYNHSFAIGQPKPLRDNENFTRVGLTGGVHRSIYLETRLTGGLIHNAAGAPLAERFLGGNVVQRFIPDDSWSIPAGAFIRSIAENRLGSTGSSPGGGRFYSANATIAFTAWGRPFLPKEMIESESGSSSGTGFPEILNLPFNTAAKAIANTKELKDLAFLAEMKDVSAKAAQLGQKNDDLFSVLKQIPSDLAGQMTLKPLISAVRSNALAIRTAAADVAKKPDPKIIGPLTTSTVPALVTAVNQLAPALSDTAAANLALRLQNLASEMSHLSAQIGRENNVPQDKYLDAAWEQLAPGHRALDVILHDLNIYSISPALMFDIARVWPAPEGTRYGIGPGLRLSLFNVNVTLGYSFSPRRLPGEEPGAIYVKLDITTLF
jgi:hypothetical protein